MNATLSGFGLTSAQIEKSTSKYVLKRKNDGDNDGHRAKKAKRDEIPDAFSTACSVCLDDFNEGETLRRFSCKHVFHAHCVDEWLKRRPTCPNCRMDIRQNDQQETQRDHIPISTEAAANFMRSVSNRNLFWPFGPQLSP